MSSKTATTHIFQSGVRYWPAGVSRREIEVFNQPAGVRVGRYILVVGLVLESIKRSLMTVLKSDEKADLPTDLAVLPRKLSYRVSRNYVSIFFCV